MAPYLRPGSSLWQIRRRSLPGYGDTGVLATGVRDRRTAERMETMLVEIAERALTDRRYRDLLTAICHPAQTGTRAATRLPLTDVLRARTERRTEALLASLTDPLLVDVAAEMRPDMERGSRIGLDRFLRAVGDRARVSDIVDATRLRRILIGIERGDPVFGGGEHAPPMLRNSVHRQVLRAVSALLRRVLGRAERDRIIAGLDFPATDDTRDVVLSPAEVGALLTAAAEIEGGRAGETHPLAHELHAVILCALTTGADRGVLLAGARNEREGRGLLVRDVAVYSEGEGEGARLSCEVSLVHDTKTTNRGRTVRGGHALAAALLPLCRGRGADEPVFAIRYEMLDYLWQRARERAGLGGAVRFKDLRAQYAIYADRAGVPTAVVSSSMGHRHESMTARYQRHTATLTTGQAQSVEDVLLGTAA